MKSYKALDLYGFQPFFFKQYWDIIYDDVWCLVRDAFEHGHFGIKLVETLVLLIPKIDHPKKLNQFRSISLCNVIYKLITKVLANRLRPFLHELVSPLQSSYIQGRGTVDNAIVA